MDSETRLPFCNCCRNRQMRMTHLIYSSLLVLLLGLVDLPCGFTHIASVLEDDDVPGFPMKPIPRGPTVAPVPSPETLDQFEQLISKEAGTTDERFYNPTDAIRNLLSFSSASSNHRLQGMKRVSQFHGNGGGGKLLGTPSGTYYRPPYQQTSWGDDLLEHTLDEEEKPTFVPYIGARALTNIPQFFEHLKENLEALKLSPRFSDSEENDEDSSHENDENDHESEMADGSYNQKDHSKMAARRMKTELLVDENLGRTSGNSNHQPSENWSSKQNWKPHAAGHIHYYSPKTHFVDSPQNILRRANNYNPAWLYTNLGLGKRRR